MLRTVNLAAFCVLLMFSTAPSVALQGSSRRAFINKATASIVAGTATFGAGVAPGVAAPQIFTTKKGVKYAILKKEGKDNTVPLDKDIVAIEYTGYLRDGSIFGRFKQHSGLLPIYCGRFSLTSCVVTTQTRPTAKVKR